MKGTRIARNTLALLLLAITALVVNVSYAKKAGKPRKLPKPVFFINENNEVCQELVKTINSTPDFFDNVRKKGDAYILLESPFKREKVEEIPPNYFIATAMAGDARQNLYLARMQVWSCQDRAKTVEECEANYHMKRFMAKPASYFEPWLEAAPKGGFFYSTPTNALDGKFPEKTMGFISRHIADGWRSTHPITLSYLAYAANGLPVPDMAWGISEVGRFSFMDIPVDIQGKTYDMSVRIEAENTPADLKKKWGKHYFINTVYLSEYRHTMRLGSDYICDVHLFQPKGK